MGLNETIFGTPGQTQIHQAPGTKPPGYGFAKDFANWLPQLMQQQFPGWGGNFDPGMSPTMQESIRRAQGYAQSGPSEIMQGVQGTLGGFMSSNFMNPWNSLFGGSPNYGGVDPMQRMYGGGPAQGMTFQNGMGGQQGPGGMMSSEPSMPGRVPNGQPSPMPQQGPGGPGGGTGMPGGAPGFRAGEFNPNGPGGRAPMQGGMRTPGGAPPGPPAPPQGLGGMPPGAPGGGMRQMSMPQSMAPGGFQSALNLPWQEAQKALAQGFQGNAQGLNQALAGQYGMNMTGQQADGREQFMHSSDHKSALQRILGREPTFDEIQQSLRSGSANIEKARTLYQQDAAGAGTETWTPAQSQLNDLINQHGLSKGSRMFNEQQGNKPMWATPTGQPGTINPPPANPTTAPPPPPGTDAGRADGQPTAAPSPPVTTPPGRPGQTYGGYTPEQLAADPSLKDRLGAAARRRLGMDPKPGGFVPTAGDGKPGRAPGIGIYGGGGATDVPVTKPVPPANRPDKPKFVTAEPPKPVLNPRTGNWHTPGAGENRRLRKAIKSGNVSY